MPRFRAARAEDTVRAAWWDEGETATFCPRFTEAMVQQRARLLEPALAELRARAEAEGISEGLRTELEQRLEGLITLRVALDSWTFRTDPTPEQAAAGEPGAIVGLTPEALAQLEAPDLAYLLEQMAARVKKVAAATVADADFRSGQPTAGTVPA